LIFWSIAWISSSIRAIRSSSKISFFLSASALKRANASASALSPI